ncbi:MULTISPECIES: beta-ketoacyl synthase N-terminal-like domain-containing protein [Paenibacillus]|uniref:beta-ketoacyl synthase N-terminal-like domain-containing protein n=1 Tax=Paenibacillus TaxID=44249 RepID=UPI00387380D1
MKREEVLRALAAKEIGPEEAGRRLAELAGPSAPSRPAPAPEPPLAQPAPSEEAEAARRAEAQVPEAIAIIGMSGRYPEADGLSAFWDNLAQGRHSVKEIPDSRWKTGLHYDPVPRKGKTYAKWLGMLEGADEFDPLFFHISPSEAECMDPQQRLFLQEGYRAFEDAGYTPERLDGAKCGVYLGIMSGEYGMLGTAKELPPGSPRLGFGQTTGSSYAIAAARLSYFLNLKGPAIPVDTACSSSLVAVHLACQALRSREIDMALAGGATLYLAPETYIRMCDAGMLSPEGRCKTFDDGADGFVPGEGVGAVVLKRLSDAEADGDSIHAVIIGSGLNQDGKTNGITAPSMLSQMELEREVYETYGIHPGSISYVEMHGTGTKLGDPIELEALSSVFREKTDRTGVCAIGSVKSNIGHTSAAAGVASIHKAALCLKHKKLVPTLHYTKPNGHFAWEESPFYVNTELKAWDSPEGSRRRAAVSSFGFSGTNAHLVMEEYQDTRPRAEVEGPLLFLLSAKSEEGLARYARNLKSWIETQEMVDLADVAYTLQVGREAMEVRLAFAADSREGLLDALRRYIALEASADLYTGRVHKNRHGSGSREGGQELAELLQTAVREHQTKQTAELWLQGLTPQWEAWYGASQPRRISLPAYPFARERYWWPDAAGREAGPSAAEAARMPARQDAANTAQAGPSAAPSTPSAGRSLRLLRKQWEPCLPAAFHSRLGTTVILAEPETLRLARELSRHLPDSRIVTPSGLRTELELPEGAWASVAGWVDLTGCAEERGASLDWIRWLQHAVEYGTRAGLTLLCVTRGLESSPAEPQSVNLAGAERAGLYRMLQSEYRHVRSRHLDADPGADDRTLAEEIAAELLMDSEDAEVCYRAGVRYRACLREITDEALLDPPARISFPPDQVLWITGGTRGIGALCAEHFVRHCGARRLVLTGREALPPRDQWDAYASEDGSGTGSKIRSIRRLETLGAQVKVLAIPLADEEAVRRSVQEVKGALGPIGGVLHCAGLDHAETPAFIRKTIESVAEVLAPKVKGLDALYRCLKEEPLRFFVLFSSVSAVVPTLAAGQSDYAMANAYMDYAAQARSGSCPMISIQWPNWKETGMGEVKSRAYEDTGLLSHTNEEGLQLLDRILAEGHGPVVLPAVVDSKRWRPERLMLRSLREEEEASAGGLSAPKGAEEAVGPSEIPDTGTERGEGWPEAVRQWVAGKFAQELRLPPSRMDADTPFVEYGVDSILLAQVLRAIRQHLPLELDPSILFEYPSIRSFASWLSETQGPLLAALLGEDTGQEALVRNCGSVEEAAAGRTAEGTDYTEQVVAAQTDAALAAAAGTGSREAASEAAIEGSPDTLTAGAAAASAMPLSPGQRYGGRIPDPALASGDIAIIGMSCRFPGADSLEAYWELLADGDSAIGAVPASRWPGADAAPYYAGLLKRPRTMAPAFFGLAGEDAAAMDPQALLVLEESLKAWCDAGYTLEEIRGRSVGVYLGGRSQHVPDEGRLLGARNPIVAVGPNYMASNISQFFDLRGPSLVLDTACSSALVSLNVAIQALRSGEVGCAMVGGVSLLGSENSHRLFRQRGLLSSEPRFHLFDARANGVVLSEGAGMILLKPLEQAAADGERIHAVIRGIAVNNDGRTAGPSTPSLQAQSEVMRIALQRSGKTAEEIGYIEVNGSGSVVSDLLELKAIHSVYRKESRTPLGLGSLKPNIGHPLCAEGIAGLIKVALMLQRRERVPFLSGQEPMKHYDLEASSFYFDRERAEWRGPRNAALSCFADGGTNAHVILEGWEDTVPSSVARRPLPLPAEAMEAQEPAVPASGRARQSSPAEPEMEESGLMVWDTFG